MQANGFIMRYAPLRPSRTSGVRRGGFHAILGAILCQGIIVGIALTIGILQPEPEKEVKFKSPEENALRAKRRKEKQIARQQRYSTPSQALNRIVSDSVIPGPPVVDIPEVPELESPELIMESNTLLSSGMSQLNALANRSKPAGPGKEIEFLGTRSRARRVIIAIDVSGSVKNKVEKAGYTMEALGKEADKAIQNLNPHTLFGIIQFSRAYDLFRPDLVPATASMKKDFSSWLEDKFSTTGNSPPHWKRDRPDGIESVVRKAYSMDPRLDLLIIVSDFDFQQTTGSGGGKDVSITELQSLTRSLQKDMIHDVKLQLIAFEPEEEATRQGKTWARENDGSFRIITK